MSTITLNLPNSLQESLEAIALDRGVSLNDLFVEIAGRISSNEALHKIKENAAKRDTRAAFEKLLASVPDVPPSRPDDVIK